MSQVAKGWVTPSWTAPAQVRALTTTRAGGVSQGRYRGLNLGAHCGDATEAVAENRRRLQAATLGTAGRLQWLTQVHGHRCIQAQALSCSAEPEADSAWTSELDLGLVIQTADCVPIVIARADGSQVGAAHGGWRGLVSGVVGRLVAAMEAGAPQPPANSGNPAHLLAWIGPAIGPNAYEVGEDVHAAVLAATGLSLERRLFRPGAKPGKWHLDLFALTEWLLRQAGVRQAYCPRICTWSDRNFYSHRRDGETGRMATLVWMAPTAA